MCAARIKKSLRHNLNRLNALLLPNGLQPITQEADLLALDSYIRNLPMAYDAEMDKSRRRSRLIFSPYRQSVAVLWPFRGTGHPGWCSITGGGAAGVRPLHREDRKKNAHMLILRANGCRQIGTTAGHICCNR